MLLTPPRQRRRVGLPRKPAGTCPDPGLTPRGQVPARFLLPSSSVRRPAPLRFSRRLGSLRLLCLRAAGGGQCQLYCLTSVPGHRALRTSGLVPSGHHRLFYQSSTRAPSGSLRYRSGALAAGMVSPSSAVPPIQRHPGRKPPRQPGPSPGRPPPNPCILEERATPLGGSVPGLRKYIII